MYRCAPRVCSGRSKRWWVRPENPSRVLGSHPTIKRCSGQADQASICTCVVDPALSVREGGPEETSILRGFAFSAIGNVTVNTPFIADKAASPSSVFYNREVNEHRQALSGCTAVTRLAARRAFALELPDCRGPTP